MTGLPIVALTCGEPAGIGPELVAPACDALRGQLALCWIGDRRHLPADARPQPITDPSEAPAAMSNGIPVLDREFAGGPRRPGIPDPAHAQGVIDAIAEAVHLARTGKVDAICTAPISKKALKDGASFAFPGHTEYLAHLAGVSHSVMMLASETLRVVPVTIHIPLAQVPRALTATLLEDTIRTTRQALISDFGLTGPKIAVAGLNPHAGEGGAMGREEMDLISPVLNALRAEGFDIAGPLPADTMFHASARARYDVAVCMYHDQALVPIKTLAFDTGVNVTLGLPFIRTSPDHGTAFDIAGTGRASPTSLVAALKMAAELGARRKDAR